MPFLMYFACCYLGGFAARKAWDVAEDVRRLAESAPAKGAVCDCGVIHD